MTVKVSIVNAKEDMDYPIIMKNDHGVVARFSKPGYGISFTEGRAITKSGIWYDIHPFSPLGNLDMKDFKKFEGVISLSNS